MSSFLLDVERDHREIERELGVNETLGYVGLTWGGVAYPCSYSTVQTVEAMQLAGFTVGIELVVRVRLKSDDSDTGTWDWTESGGPQEGDLVTFRSVTYKITSKRDIHGLLRILGLGSVNT